jgi:hypothetical protein
MGQKRNSHQRKGRPAYDCLAVAVYYGDGNFIKAGSGFSDEVAILTASVKDAGTNEPTGGREIYVGRKSERRQLHYIRAAVSSSPLLLSDTLTYNFKATR